MPQTRLSVTASYVQQGGEKWLDMTGTEEEKKDGISDYVAGQQFLLRCRFTRVQTVLVFLTQIAQFRNLLY